MMMYVIDDLLVAKNAGKIAIRYMNEIVIHRSCVYFLEREKKMKIRGDRDW